MCIVWVLQFLLLFLLFITSIVHFSILFLCSGWRFWPFLWVFNYFLFFSKILSSSIYMKCFTFSCNFGNCVFLIYGSVVPLLRQTEVKILSLLERCHFLFWLLLDTVLLYLVLLFNFPFPLIWKSCWKSGLHVFCCIWVSSCMSFKECLVVGVTCFAIWFWSWDHTLFNTLLLPQCLEISQLDKDRIFYNFSLDTEYKSTR